MSVIDPILMCRARDDHAANFTKVAVFQQHLDEELLERLVLLNTPVRSIAVLGAGNPGVVPRLLTLYPGASVALYDISEYLLQQDIEACGSAAGAYLHAEVCDLQTLPSADGMHDLVYSNLFLAMSDDPPRLLSDILRILRPGGCFHFSCLGADTFSELRAAWRVADDTSVAHVGDLPDMHDTGDALVQARFTEPVMDRTVVTMTYSSADALFTDLRDNGVRNCLRERYGGLTGKTRWRRFLAALHDGKVDGRFMLTLEAVLGQAWKPDRAVQTRLEDGSVAVPFGSLRGSLSGNSREM